MARSSIFFTITKCQVLLYIAKCSSITFEIISVYWKKVGHQCNNIINYHKNWIKLSKYKIFFSLGGFQLNTRHILTKTPLDMPKILKGCWGMWAVNYAILVVQKIISTTSEFDMKYSKHTDVKCTRQVYPPAEPGYVFANFRLIYWLN